MWLAVVLDVLQHIEIARRWMPAVLAAQCFTLGNRSHDATKGRNCRRSQRPAHGHGLASSIPTVRGADKQLVNWCSVPRVGPASGKLAASARVRGARVLTCQDHSRGVRLNVLWGHRRASLRLMCHFRGLQTRLAAMSRQLTLSYWKDSRVEVNQNFLRLLS